MLFDSTLRKELARSFGGTFVVILTIVLTIMFIRTLGQAANGRVATQDVALLLAYVGLGHLPTMLALSLFVAVVATLSRMYRGSEMTVWFASGVSLARFLRPIARTSWPVVVLIGLLAFFVWPWQNQQSAALIDQFQRRSDLSRVAPGQFQTSGDGQRTFFFEGAASDTTAGRNVLIVAGRKGGETVTTAREGRIEPGGDGRVVVLEHGQRNEIDLQHGDKTVSRFEVYRGSSGDRIRGEPPAASARAVSTADLLRDPSRVNRGELAWRIGLVLASINALVLGVGLSAANPRHASSWNLLFALLAFFAYYNLVTLTQAWIAAGRIGLGAALVIAHAGVLALGVFLVWWREHANGRPVSPRRRRRPRAAAPREGAPA